MSPEFFLGGSRIGSLVASKRNQSAASEAAHNAPHEMILWHVLRFDGNGDGWCCCFDRYSLGIGQSDPGHGRPITQEELFDVQTTAQPTMHTATQPTAHPIDLSTSNYIIPSLLLEVGDTKQTPL